MEQIIRLIPTNKFVYIEHNSKNNLFTWISKSIFGFATFQIKIEKERERERTKKKGVHTKQCRWRKHEFQQMHMPRV